MKDPEYGPYVDQLLEKAMIRESVGAQDMEIDAESYEEIRSVAMELDEEILDPEA